MRHSLQAGMNSGWLSLMAVCFTAVLGSVSTSALAQSTTQYFFTGTCSDCVGIGNLALTVGSPLVDGFQYGTQASVTYTSSILQTLTDPNASIYAADINALSATPSPQFMEISFFANDTSYAFTSCGNTPVYEAGLGDGQLCGGSGLAYGSWEVQSGTIFSTSSGLPGGVSGKIQDMGTNGVWSTIAPAAVVAAPEIDTHSAASALLLLLGGLAIARGKRVLPTLAP